MNAQRVTQSSGQNRGTVAFIVHTEQCLARQSKMALAAARKSECFNARSGIAQSETFSPKIRDFLKQRQRPCERLYICANRAPTSVKQTEGHKGETR